MSTGCHPAEHPNRGDFLSLPTRPRTQGSDAHAWAPPPSQWPELPRKYTTQKGRLHATKPAYTTAEDNTDVAAKVLPI